MTDPATLDAWKQAAAHAAVAEVADGMIVGLGTGSTAAHAIAAIGARVARGLAIRAVATSLHTHRAALAAGIAMLDFADVPAIDLCIDGVDEIDPALRAIKGGGGAMLREKIVATAATRMIAIADATKPVAQLGMRPVPVEVLPFARAFVSARIAALGGQPVLREAAGAVWHSDQGNILLDCAFGQIADPAALADALAAIPGLLGHGLFLDEIAAAYVAGADGVLRCDKAAHRDDEP